jgi:hypothetical protein
MEKLALGGGDCSVVFIFLLLFSFPQLFSLLFLCCALSVKEELHHLGRVRGIRAGGWVMGDLVVLYHVPFFCAIDRFLLPSPNLSSPCVLSSPFSFCFFATSGVLYSLA